MPKPQEQPTYPVFYYDIKPKELHPLGETTGVAFGYAYDYKRIKGENWEFFDKANYATPKNGLVVQHNDKLSLKINGQEAKLSTNPLPNHPLEKGKHPR